MTERIFPRWLSKILSYLSAFNLGIYTYVSLHGQPVEFYRWFITIAIGLLFYLDSERK